ncbi:putative lipoprotein [Granulicella sibirica]|uniref:Putative lipoprotein n=2 Tax=Granulicella sibirica TaxID=2479048 RepID=A0A4Q0T1C9_9BACT|nr:putative lipoprotein [Granulicella sibirica]
MQSFQIPSHGSLMNGLMYVAAGPGPHPTVILLHGFPGNERNLDLAQDMRRAGWNVLYFNYRGSWGSPGDFSFSHGIEDVASAVAYVKQPETAAKLRVDSTRIVLVGHSMGGMMAVVGGAADPSLLAVGVISGADIAGHIPEGVPRFAESTVAQKMGKRLEAEGMAPLAGCTPEGLGRDAFQHAAQWRFLSRVDSLKTRPILDITSDDGLAAENDAFSAALRAAGDQHVTTLHLATDHSYSDERLALSAAVLDWLKTLPASTTKP